MSIGEFLSQGGYAFYVWCAYGMVAAAVAAEIAQLALARRAAAARARRLDAARASGEHPA